MAYESLIAALLEEGEAKCKAVLQKAQTEAARLIAEAHAAAEGLGREADIRLRDKVVRQRTEILGRAALQARQLQSQTKHEVLDAVWRRVTEKALALRGSVRTTVLRALLDELLAAAPPGPYQVVIESRERGHVEEDLKKQGVPFVQQRRDDLVLGMELQAAGERLQSSFASRLAKAKPELTIELNRLLFADRVSHHPRADR